MTAWMGTKEDPKEADWRKFEDVSPSIKLPRTRERRPPWLSQLVYKIGRFFVCTFTSTVDGHHRGIFFFLLLDARKRPIDREIVRD